MLADTLGRPLRFIITAGQGGDVTTAPALLDGLSAETVLADKVYDSNALRALMADIAAAAVTLRNRCRKVAIPHDPAIYSHRNQIEHGCAKCRSGPGRPPQTELRVIALS